MSTADDQQVTMPVPAVLVPDQVPISVETVAQLLAGQANCESHNVAISGELKKTNKRLSIIAERFDDLADLGEKIENVGNDVHELQTAQTADDDDRKDRKRWKQVGRAIAVVLLPVIGYGAKYLADDYLHVRETVREQAHKVLRIDENTEGIRVINGRFDDITSGQNDILNAVRESDNQRR